MSSENVILRPVLIDLSLIPSHLAFKMCSNYPGIKLLKWTLWWKKEQIKNLFKQLISTSWIARENLRNAQKQRSKSTDFHGLNMQIVDVLVVFKLLTDDRKRAFFF